MKSFAVLDLDGALRPLQLAGEHVPPLHGVGKILKAVRRGGLRLAVATGAGFGSVRATERSMAFRFDDVVVSGGARLVRRGNLPNHDRLLVPEEEIQALAGITPSLDQVRVALSGRLADTGTGYTAFFRPRSQEWETMRDEAARLVQGLPLRLSANGDGGVSVFAASACKQRPVDWIKDLGREIAVGVGDSASDAPILWASLWPIVTRPAIGVPLDDTLVEIVRTKGRGYLARGDEPHGYGLIAGLRAAREAGVISY